MRLYIAGYITGLTFEQASSYFTRTRDLLADVGYEVYHPFTGKGQLRREAGALKSSDYIDDSPLLTAHGITHRDHWMVKQADVVLMDLSRAREVGHPSIGCTAELAWCFAYQKHSVVVRQSDDPYHHHAFINEMATVIYPDLDSALHYLAALIAGDL